jgi:hypothetical protein
MNDDDDCPHGLGMRIACSICLGKLKPARRATGRPWWGDSTSTSTPIRHDAVPASGRDLSRVIEREWAPSFDSVRHARWSPTRGQYVAPKARFTRGAPHADPIRP